MAEFKKYSSIENTFDKEFMERIYSAGLDSLQYVVQEKVHGANTCFVTDGQEVQFAKRTGLVEKDEQFYDYEELLERYKDKVRRLFQLIKSEYPDTESVLAYGEMFGGRYPHPEVQNFNKVMLIQKGVAYSPIHDFYGFDIYVNGDEKHRYLTVDEVNKFYEGAGFLYAKTLFKGTLKECLEYPNAFQSKIAEWLGFPPVDDNICEGIVIRPVEPTYLNNGARVLLKSKNARFAEKKSVKKRNPQLFVEPSYSEALTAQLEAVEEYVTENRLNNVVSKIGQVSIPRETGKLIGLFNKDALEDYMKEHAGEYELLEKSEQKIVTKHLNSLSAALIKKVYMGLA